MKKIILLLSFSAVLLVFFLYSRNDDLSQNQAISVKTSQKNQAGLNDKGSLNSTIDKRTSLENIEDKVSIKAAELAQAMYPPDDVALRDIWQQAYGCPKPAARDEDACLFASILTADSYEEALWMKRNGFPHFDRLSVAADEDNYPYLEELAQAGFKPALSLTAKILSSLGQHDEAMKRAVQYLNQSNQNEIYAYRLMGEIASAKDPMNPYVIRDYQMAALLGDPEARRLAINYAQNAEIMEEGMRLLIQSLEIMFGLSLDSIPKDPRPVKP